MYQEKEIKPNKQFNKHYGIAQGYEANFLLSLLEERQHSIVYIALDDQHMEETEQMLRFFSPAEKIICFPAWDCLPYDRVSPSNDVVGLRLGALSAILNKQQPSIILTTVNAVVQKVIPQDILKNSAFSIQKGCRLDVDSFKGYLSINGYHKVETVHEAGEFAVRGGIIDIYPAANSSPVRIDLFGDEVESLKSFDLVSQRSLEEVYGLELLPASEIFINNETIQNFRGEYRRLFGAVQNKDDNPLYSAVSEGRKHAGAEHWLPLFYKNMETLFDYVGQCSTVFTDQVENARQDKLAQIYDFYDARKESLDSAVSHSSYNPTPVDSLFIDHKTWDNILQEMEDVNVLLPFSAQDTGNTAYKSKKGRDFADIRIQSDKNIYEEVVSYINLLQQSKKRVLVAGYSEGSCVRLKAALEEYNLSASQQVASFDSVCGLKKGVVGFCVLPLERGFETESFAIITEQDILGDRLVRPSTRKKSRRKLQDVLDDIAVLSEGDYVVHEEHGIGQFMGLETLTVQRVSHDFLKIMYAGEDKLFVPVENLEVLSRYGTDNTIVHLDKLGGAGWQSRKARIKKDLMEIAEELMKVAAARVLRRADKLSVSDDIYQEFVVKFPYNETEDQANAIEDVLSDLDKEQAMDRLICGDVGFGKTEVALRAAFVAAMAGKQVAILTPTTLLCRQHYQGFCERFHGFGLSIEQLSRMVKPSDADKTRKGLTDGSVNIVIGTHALLSDKIKFNSLGLVIVDEEQRFGVKQKEKLKKIREEAHVLAMTATPIPRTLQLSMAGIRDMSLITTPPVDRLAVRTFVSPFDAVVLRDALMREYHRGGQSFYVCPRVADIAKLEKYLQDIVPELKYTVAHGQMTTEELENRITAFYEGKYDILLSTTIIESGLDIPNANTMIIHRADMFGLSQLYQIRGRIGRSKQRAYAYLTYSQNKPLTKTALQRLQVIDQLDMLGAGFQLASHDLDIRGAGNLLGENQSGHIREIGIELYQKMLEEAVSDIKSNKGEDKEAEDKYSWTPEINLGISVMIPERYVADLNLRLSLYRRLGNIETQDDINSFAAEMIDRFGDLPEEVDNLFETMAIKHLCRQAGVEKLDVGPKGAVVTFYNNQFSAVEKLVQYIADSSGTIKIRPDQTLAYIRSWHDLDLRVQGTKRILQELISLSV